MKSKKKKKIVIFGNGNHCKIVKQEILENQDFEIYAIYDIKGGKIKKSLKHEIGNRPIVIWGARMTGLGLVRFAKAEQINVLGFIDSDSALIGRKINGILVHKPNDLTKLEKKNPK